MNTLTWMISYEQPTADGLLMTVLENCNFYMPYPSFKEMSQHVYLDYLESITTEQLRGELMRLLLSDEPPLRCELALSEFEQRVEALTRVDPKQKYRDIITSE